MKGDIWENQSDQDFPTLSISQWDFYSARIELTLHAFLMQVGALPYIGLPWKSAGSTQAGELSFFPKETDLALVGFKLPTLQLAALHPTTVPRFLPVNNGRGAWGGTH